MPTSTMGLKMELESNVPAGVRDHRKVQPIRLIVIGAASFRFPLCLPSWSGVLAAIVFGPCLLLARTPFRKSRSYRMSFFR